MILCSVDLLLRKNCEWKNFCDTIPHKYYKRITLKLLNVAQSATLVNLSHWFFQYEKQISIQ